MHPNPIASYIRQKSCANCYQTALLGRSGTPTNAVAAAAPVGTPVLFGEVDPVAAAGGSPID